MLILSRKPGEDIYIGKNFRIIVLEQSRSGDVHLGIEAPPEVAIVRGELMTARSARAASQTSRQQVSAGRKPSEALPYPKRSPNTPYPDQRQLPPVLSAFRTGRR